MQTMRDQIVARIERLGEGRAFSAKDFLDIASRGTIDMARTSLRQPERNRKGGTKVPFGSEHVPINRHIRAIARFYEAGRVNVD